MSEELNAREQAVEEGAELVEDSGDISDMVDILDNVPTQEPEMSKQDEDLFDEVTMNEDSLIKKGEARKLALKPEEKNEEKVVEEEETVVEEEVKEGEEEEEEEEELTTEEALAKAQEQIQALLATINNGAVVELPEGIEETLAPTVDPKVVAEQAAAAEAEKLAMEKNAYDISDEEFTEILEDKGKFTNFLKGREHAIFRAALSQQSDAINKTMNMRMDVGQFFQEEKNKDILPLRELVMKTAITIEDRHPDWSTTEKMEASATAVRKQHAKALAMASKGSARTAKPKPGKFAQTAPSRRAAPTATPTTADIEKEGNEVADMIDLMQATINE